MDDLLKALIRWLRKRALARFTSTDSLVAASIVVASLIIIWDPLHKPHLILRGNAVSFRLPPFQACRIGFNGNIRILSYIEARKEFVSAGQTGMEVHTTNVDKDLSALDIKSLFVNQETFQYESNCVVTINFGSVIDLEVDSVSLDNREVVLSSFAKDYLTSPGKLRQAFYIREWLATALHQVNDPVSNLVLTIMWVGICFLAWTVARMEWAAYFYGASQFEMRLGRLCGFSSVRELSLEQRRDALSRCDAFWEQWDGRFRFWQMLGPAIGFVLTVSSLIQAFFTVRSVSDIESFTQGLNIAMVSTFLGLLLRIIALEAERVNLRLLIKADLALGGEELRSLRIRS